MKAVLLALVAMSLPLLADNLDTLGRQLRANPVPVPSLIGDLSAERALETLRADGTWADIDYRDGKDFRIFPPAAHLRRLNLILDSAATAADETEKTKRRDAAHRALSAWLRLDPHSNQGWFETIGVPQLVGRAALEFEGKLTPEQKRQVFAMLRRCVRDDGELIYAGSPATGQNLQWQAGLQIIGGYLERDPARVERYVRRIEREIRITEEEGIQTDMSFQQHGRQLYAGGYGLGFVTDGARLAVQTRGTSFALSPATVDLLTRLLLDGQQGMLRGRNWDFTAIGREIARENRDALGLNVAADQLATFGGPRAAELTALARRVRGDDPVTTAPAKFRMFWRSDFVSQTRPNFYFSARMTSTRMNGSEAGNGENELGAYLGDGATAIMRRGDEYRGIFPLWDWRRIPGVTNAYQPDMPLPVYEWGKGFGAANDFAGGAGDGKDGLAAMTLDRLGVHAAKAWFFLGNVVICLGADIRAKDPQAPLITTLNQCRARGPLAKGTATPGNVRWVHHDGITYLAVGEGALRAEIKNQTGRWRDIDRLQGRPDKLSGDVFTAFFDHGDTPASYAYIVAPGLAPDGVEKFLQNDVPRIAVNTGKIQAVTSASGDLAQVVFRAPGELRLPDGRTIRADAPALLQWRRLPDGKSVLVAGNPTQKVTTLRVTLDGKTEVRFDFPADPATAGKPQERSLAAAP